jgi:hypothetical protein
MIYCRVVERGKGLRANFPRVHRQESPQLLCALRAGLRVISWVHFGKPGLVAFSAQPFADPRFASLSVSLPIPYKTPRKKQSFGETPALAPVGRALRTKG